MRKRVIKFFICFCMVFLLGLSLKSNTILSVKAAETIITADEALNIAAAHVNSDRVVSEDSFKEDIHVSESNILYNLDGSISAYLFQFEDSKKAPSGYVIVGASREQMAIIEYAYDGSCFLYKARSTVMEKEDQTENNIIFYYTGLNYYIGKNVGNYVYLVTSNGLDKINKSLMSYTDKCKFNDDGLEEVNQQWTNLENNIEDNFSVKKPTKANIIFEKSTYKSAYESIKSAAVNNYTKFDFITTDDFKRDLPEKSAALCGTNLLLYWYYQDVKYADLLQISWKNVFESLYYDMVILQNTMEQAESFYTELKDYIKDYGEGYSSISYCGYNADWDDIDWEIDSKYPVTLILQSGNDFEREYVLGMGYRVYNWDTGSSKYIMIVDGQSKKATRHIGFVDGYRSEGGMGLLRLRPY